MMRDIKSFVSVVLDTIGRGAAVLTGIAGRQAGEARRAPARAQRPIYRALEPEAQTRRMGDPGPMDSGCIVYRRPGRAIREG